MHWVKANNNIISMSNWFLRSKSSYKPLKFIVSYKNNQQNLG